MNQIPPEGEDLARARHPAHAEVRQVLRAATVPARRARPVAAQGVRLQGAAAGEAATASPVQRQRDPAAARLRRRAQVVRARPASGCSPRWRPGSTRWCCGPASPARSTRRGRRWRTGTSRSTAARWTGRPTRSSPDRRSRYGSAAAPKTPFQVAAAGAHELERRAPYLETSVSDLRTTLVREPARSEIPVICDEQLVVEFYSR